LRRSPAGEWVPVVAGGEHVEAFVPNPLPPAPAPIIDLSLEKRIEQALLALGRLDSASVLLPETHLFLYTYVRKEAVLSSQIEGTQSSLSDLLLFEMDEAPGVPVGDVTEVSNYVAALEHGLARIREGFPISNRLIRDIHRVLLSRGRGASKQPGEFRRSQNWVGGTRAANASFVPPPHERVEDCMAALERFLNDQPVRTPTLLKAALAHVQFETIHPFLDGNGRVGRLLITLQLCADGVLHEPLLYLSLYFKRHRQRYYELLNQVRNEGAWAAWIEFFVDAVLETAQDAVETANSLGKLFREDRTRIEGSGRVAGSALRVHECLTRRPLATVAKLAEQSRLSTPAVANALEALANFGIIHEITGRKRNRVFAYSRYMGLLGEEAP
jgi:cell filamentation protein, protein adenylyltransferase